MIGLASPSLTRGICAPARSLAALTRRRLGSARNARDRGALQIVSEGTGRFIVGGNWKCNGDRASVTALIEALNGGDVGDNVDVVVAPPFLYVDQALSELKSPMQVAAQNAWVEYTLEDETHHYDSDSGAFTGEVRRALYSTRPIDRRTRPIDRWTVRPFGYRSIGRRRRAVSRLDDAIRPRLRSPSPSRRPEPPSVYPSVLFSSRSAVRPRPHDPPRQRRGHRAHQSKSSTRRATANHITRSTQVSAEMLEDMGVPWVILGHSERRTLLGEDDTMVGKKVAHARFHGLSVIVCVGESLEQREAGATMDVIFKQLRCASRALALSSSRRVGAVLFRFSFFVIGYDITGRRRALPL
jgi:triosephosphate isomerase